jgi:hydroxyacylglutathione hydrolase
MQNLPPSLIVRPVRALSDNYIWLIEAPGAPDRVVAVDPGEAAPVVAELERSGGSLAAILLTHHHPDHIGGVGELLGLGSVPVLGPDDARIPRRTRTVRDNERCEFPELGLAFEILAVPGHTLSHIAYVGHGALFSGDTLFSAGCGRMFEGTPTQMNASLDRLRALPPDTRMFCGHEYTAANLRFALTVDPGNRAAQDHRDALEQLRTGDAPGRVTPSLPSPLSLEIRINPFLRCDAPVIRAAAEAHAGRTLPQPADVFAVLRAWKDTFR